MDYKIKGFLKSGRPDTRVVHQDNLISFEKPRSEVFRDYFDLPHSSRCDSTVLKPEEFDPDFKAEA